MFFHYVTTTKKPHAMYAWYVRPISRVEQKILGLKPALRGGKKV